MSDEKVTDAAFSVTLAQLLTAAHVLKDYEDDYDPATEPVLIEMSADDDSVWATLDGISYHVTDDGRCLDARGHEGSRR